MNKLYILQIKIPQEWREPLEQKIQQKGYVTTNKAIPKHLRETSR